VQTLQLTPVDVNRVIAGMDEVLRRTIGAATRIETAFALDLWPAQVDENLLVEIVLNLSLTARDAMPSGGTVRIETVNVPEFASGRPNGLDRGDFVRVSVIDGGSGASPNILGNNVEPFRPTAKQFDNGTGLGLSLVHGAAKRIGGTVEVERRFGGGTAVRLYLPRAESGGERAAAGAAVVLVVDDDPDVRQVTAEYLDQIGIIVIEAESGPKALALLDAGGRVDLLLADFAMPEMNGAELLRRARSARPGMAALLMTGYAKDGAMIDALGVGVLRKPFPLAALGAKVRELLGIGAETPRALPEPAAQTTSR
jgi:CheY-like chemotaxis protein